MPNPVPYAMITLAGTLLIMILMFYYSLITTGVYEKMTLEQKSAITFVSFLFGYIVFVGILILIEP
jgi:hypothetical protein